jgi:hypothetical protein
MVIPTCGIFKEQIIQLEPVSRLRTTASSSQKKAEEEVFDKININVYSVALWVTINYPGWKTKKDNL